MNLLIFSFINPKPAECGDEGIWYNLADKEIAWIIFIILGLVAAIRYFLQAKKVKKHATEQARLFSAFGFFVLGIICGRILFILSDIERWNNCQTPLHAQFVLFAYAFALLSSVDLIIVLEQKILQFSHHYFSFIFISAAIIAVILLVVAQFAVEILNTIRLFFTILSIIGISVLLYFYLKIIFKTTGSIRKNALLTFSSLLLVVIGSILDGELIIRSLSIPIWVPAIFPIIGLSLLIYSQTVISQEF